ncbi:hypothetical protein Tco_0839000 [Tanacetum coccineum]|uniref:Reverse transcriptase domain-containing protein n=1 Tax=Tanacetum coccineum TaxID=301880 RepID=A0ABQ5AQ89_9ASTR
MDFILMTSLNFMEEPVEIMDREVKRLKRSCIPIVKVRWNSKRGPEFTWECEDQFQKKYPHLFTKTAPSSNFVMSDSEDSTVTYTEVSSPFEDLSDIGSQGVIIHGYDGLPMMPEDPYAYVEAVMQEPPLPDFVSEPTYPEFMPPEDDVLPAKEQPLPTAVSPTADSPGHITEFDPEEDLKEDDEDPEEDLTGYPTNRDDEEEEEESSRDDVDNKEEDEDEEEHLAPTDSVPPPAYQFDRLLAISTLPSSPLTSYSSPLPQIPSPPLPVSSPLPILPSPLLASPTHSLSYRATMIRASMVMMRVAAPSTYILASQSETPPSGTPPLLSIPLPTSSPPLLLPSIDFRVDVPEVTLPPRKRFCIAPGPRYKIGESSFAPTTRLTGGFRADYSFVGTLDAEIRRDPDREIGYKITDVWVDLDEIAEEIPASDSENKRNQDDNQQQQDKRQNTSRAYTAGSAQQTEIGDLRATDRRRQAQLTEALTLLRTLQTQMAALQSQQRPARNPAHPDVPEEAGSSS